MSAKRELVGDVIVDGDVIKSATMDTTSQVSVGSKAKGNLVIYAEELEHTLDWSGTTMAELLHLASATVIIKLQSNWRKVGHACNSEQGETTNVHEFINRPINRTMRPAQDVVLDKVASGEIKGKELDDLIAALQAKRDTSS